jgi:DNA polymerase delta subunit 2
MATELSIPETYPPQRPPTTYSSLSELSKPFLIDPSSRSYKHQYANIYFVRLVELRPIVEERAGERWGGVRGQSLYLMNGQKS